MLNATVNQYTATNLPLNLLLLFGLLLFGGAFGARFFQKLRIPQVVGCIIVGVILGEGLNLVTADTLETLKPFTIFALGIIGFMIGGQLKRDIFKKYGRQFFIILCSEGIGAFLLVAAGGAVVAWFMTHSLNTSIAVGI